MKQERFSRQSFLGRDAELIIEEATVGIVGLGGGGSHIVQQLAHIGFTNYVIYDPDVVEESNLNRLVGATREDARLQTPKVLVAERVISGLIADPNIRSIKARWQESPAALRECDLVFGCLDRLQDRSELEVCSRRFVFPYIDIGLGVRVVGGEAPRMAGQVVLSMPGAPCFRCLGFLNERDLAEEAARYGDAGPRPQVVWANGVLAATAVGVAVDLLTDWTAALRNPVYLSYDGNTGTIMPHPRLRYLTAKACEHFEPDEVGEPNFLPLPTRPD
jgi:hypothetical protein